MSIKSLRKAEFDRISIADKLQVLARGSVNLFGFVSLVDFTRAVKEDYFIQIGMDDLMEFLQKASEKDGEYSIHEFEGDSFLISRDLMVDDDYYFDDDYQENEGEEHSDGALARFVDL